MSLYAVRISKVTTVNPGHWLIERVGYLARGRVVRRGQCTWYSSPSAAKVAGKRYTDRSCRRGWSWRLEYEVIPYY